MEPSPQPHGKKPVPGRVLLLAYVLGVVLAAGTQLAVMVQHGPKVYVSPLWAALYPARLFIADLSMKCAYPLHLSLRGATAGAIGIAVSSALFGLIVSALVGLTRSGKRFARYIGFGGLGILVVLAVLWGIFPPLI